MTINKLTASDTNHTMHVLKYAVIYLNIFYIDDIITYSMNIPEKKCTILLSHAKLNRLLHMSEATLVMLSCFDRR